jgi:hypothetical protein
MCRWFDSGPGHFQNNVVGFPNIGSASHTYIKSPSIDGLYFLNMVDDFPILKMN